MYWGIDVPAPHLLVLNFFASLLRLETFFTLTQIRHKAIFAFRFDRFAAVTAEKHHRLMQSVQVGFEFFR
jgi:hypothetical protein